MATILNRMALMEGRHDENSPTFIALTKFHRNLSKRFGR
jgi:hypothetical protein